MHARELQFASHSAIKVRTFLRSKATLVGPGGFKGLFEGFKVGVRIGFRRVLSVSVCLIFLYDLVNGPSRHPSSLVLRWRLVMDTSCCSKDQTETELSNQGRLSDDTESTQICKHPQSLE